MSHLSVKILLDDALPDSELAARLQGKLGAQLSQEQRDQTDRLYSFMTNGQTGAMLKVRDTEGQGTDIIFEQAQIEDGFRRSSVCVTSPRGLITDAPIEDIIGAPDHVIPKTRKVYTSPAHPRLRLYVDTYHAPRGDKRFLEIQMQSSGDAAADKKEISEIISVLGLSSMPALTDSYALLAAGAFLPNEPGLLEALGKMPSDMLGEIGSFPVLKADGPSRRLITRGEKADEAYLIMKGRAHVVEEDVTLYPGMLVGEFAALEHGVRTTSVDLEEGAEVLALPRAYTARLLRTPAFAMKYVTWKVDQAQARLASACTYG